MGLRTRGETNGENNGNPKTRNQCSKFKKQIIVYPINELSKKWKLD
jgi:hypothetical protein